MKKSSLSKVLLSLALTLSPLSMAADVVWYDGQNPVNYKLPKKYDPVVATAADMFASDMQAVTGHAAVKGQTIEINQLDKASASTIKSLKKYGVPVDKLLASNDGFNILTYGNKIYVTGANGRGAAYGLLELSRMAGVSPWIWWGDVVPEHKDKLTLPDNFSDTQSASVEYRGVFLNDEDWSLRPWSNTNYEPADSSEIGPRTYRRIFELLLRMRANAIWPAMHTGTKAFFKTKGAKAVADSCGIAIGSSHCEPLLRNNVDEWNVAERGDYNYRTNREGVHSYWIERLNEVKGSAGGNMFTIGMRGIHDSSMEGYKTTQEKFDGLQQVINDQQELLRKYIGDPSKQIQVFVPYKEVLELYEQGLQVPDYVTLMWCDDNYGYMTRLSDEKEQKRPGGGGVYYHLSYWGRPHDYLWLTTTQPGLVYNEMKAAYDHNVRKIWITNVHDPKVAGYQMELFLDMAWDINSVSGETVGDHYKNWLCRQFGKEAGEKIYPAMHEFYRLCGQRRPEFMGWNQVEVDKKYYHRGLSPVVPTQFSSTELGGELYRYLKSYAEVAKTINDAQSLVRPELRDAYFAAISYPVLSAEANARKHLYSQIARQYANGSTPYNAANRSGKSLTATALSQQAYQDIRKLTDHYNNVMAGGKWKGSMDMSPRDLPVGGAPVTPTLLTDAEVKEWASKAANLYTPKEIDKNIIARNADTYKSVSEGAHTVAMLGHSMNAVALPKNGSASYTFTTGNLGDVLLHIALIPTQPNDSGDLRFNVSVDGAEPTEFTLKEPFRSEQWKQNVLRGQARRTIPLNLAAGEHTLTITALDPHIILDQWMIDTKPNRNFYLIPAE